MNINFQIWYVTGILLFLSIRRIVTDDFEVDSNPMMIVAGCAVVFNIILGVLLHGAGHAHSHGGGGTNVIKLFWRMLTLELNKIVCLCVLLWLSFSRKLNL
jgi:Co/Zn/Cd efflux system component